MDFVATFALILVLAFLTESMVEYFLGWIVRIKPYLMYVSAAVGIALAIVYQLDMIAVFFKGAALTPFAGYVLTGLVIGRGANFVHDIAKNYFPPIPGLPQPPNQV